MGEVSDELWRGVLETGTAVVTDDMIARDAWRALSAAERDKLSAMVNLYGAEPNRVQRAALHPLQRQLFEAEQAEREELGHGALNPMYLTCRATPARPLRLRVCLDAVDGPPWLQLLAQCAWIRGGIIGDSPDPDLDLPSL